MSSRLAEALGIGAVLALTCAVSDVRADTVRLKSGRTIEGDIVRQSDEELVVVVNGRPEFFAPSEVDSVTRSNWHLALPTRPTMGTAPAFDRDLGVDKAFFGLLGGRLQEVHQALAQLPLFLKEVRGHHEATTREMGRHIATLLLPASRGKLDLPRFAVDMVLVLLFRAPLLWLVLLSVRGQAPFPNVLAVTCLIYGGLLVGSLLAVLAFERSLLIGLGVVLLGAIGTVGGLVPWCLRLFDLGVARTVTALLLALGLMVGLEHLALQLPLLRG